MILKERRYEGLSIALIRRILRSHSGSVQANEKQEPLSRPVCRGVVQLYL